MYIVKQAMLKGCDEAVASVFSYRISYLKIANSKVDSIVTKDERGGSLFVSQGKRVFSTNIDTLSGPNVAAAIRNAKRNLAHLEPKDDYYGIASGPFKYRKQEACDSRIRDYDNDTISDIAQAAINEAAANGADNVAGTLILSRSSETIATSKGVHQAEDSAHARLSIRAFVNGLSAQKIAASKRLKDLGPAALGRTTAELASMADSNGKVTSGTYDIIYMQQPAGLLFSMVNEMACVGNVETGGFLMGKLGKTIADKKLEIYDDGASSKIISASRFDAEGCPTRKTQLIGDGRLLTYLHNNSTAAKYKTKSTGNAGLVMPSPNALVLEHKNTSKSIDRLISGIDKGILVTNTWYTRFSNYRSGDFSTVPRDIAVYIEKGRPKFAIRQVDVGSATGIRISENVFRMLKSTVRSANDTIQTASWDSDGYFVTPSVLVTGVKVTTA